MSRSYQVKVSDGGRLAPSLSIENLGAANYVKKTNWRRSKDQEIRREGWIKFKPNASGSDNQAVMPNGQTVKLLAELVRPNGDRVVVAATRQVIYKFDTGSNTWTQIGSGYSASGKRWQIVTINGFLILNNTVDLPQYFRVENAAVLPIYEMREVGISSCGRITEYNGFLFLGNVTEIDGNQLNKWMNGYSSYTVLGTSAKAANFAIVSGDSGTQFNVTTAASQIVATLPGTVPGASFYIWIKKVDAGAGTVITSPALVDQQVVLANINDEALLWSDGVGYFSKVFAGGVIPATAPYGIPPSDILNVIPFEVAWSAFGQPTNWAPIFSLTQAASSATVVLPFASQVFVAGQTRVAVLNGGPGGGTLGGDSAHPNGILVTAVSGATLTLEIPTDASISYPRTISVLRWTDLSTLVGKSQIQGDGSAIIGMLKINEILLLYRTTGVYYGRYTGNASTPFVFRERYGVRNVPKWGDAIVNVNGDYHLYPGVGNRFYKFDGQTEAVVHTVCDDYRDQFFAGVLDADELFAYDNPITKEVWFCNTALTLAFDYEFNTISTIDQAIDALAYVQRPAATDKWFILAIGPNVYTYGNVTGITPIKTWLRDGVVPAYTGFKSGLMSANDQESEKDIIAYVPILSSESPDVQITVNLYSTYNPGVTPVALFTPGAILTDPNANDFMPLLYRSIYFQDEVILSDTRDIDARFSLRIFRFDQVASDIEVERT